MSGTCVAHMWWSICNACASHLNTSTPTSTDGVVIGTVIVAVGGIVVAAENGKMQTDVVHEKAVQNGGHVLHSGMKSENEPGWLQQLHKRSLHRCPCFVVLLV